MAENSVLAQALTKIKSAAETARADRVFFLETELSRVQGLLEHQQALSAVHMQLETKLETDLGKVQRTLADTHQSELLALQGAIDSAMEERAQATSALENTVAQKEAEIHEATAKANALDARASALETIVAEMKTSSFDKEAALLKAQSELTAATSTLGDAEGKVSALESKLAEKRNKLATARAELNAAQQENCCPELEAAQAEGEVLGSEVTELAKVQAELDLAEKEQASASSGLQTVWNTVHEKETEIAETKSKLQSLESTVTELNTASVEMTAALTVLVGGGFEPPNAIISMKPEDSVLTAKEQEEVAEKVQTTLVFAQADRTLCLASMTLQSFHMHWFT